MQHRRWFERQFPHGLAPEQLPDIIERLRGTPVRIEERVRPLSRTVLTRQQDGHWSIQENVGHLLDLEALWSARVEELRSGATVLSKADLTNRKTHDARHNDTPIAALLGAFRQARTRLVGGLEIMSDHDVQRTALHPRLQQPMSVVDLAHFVAEHDDHHLARITAILSAANPSSDARL